MENKLSNYKFTISSEDSGNIELIVKAEGFKEAKQIKDSIVKAKVIGSWNKSDSIWAEVSIGE